MSVIDKYSNLISQIPVKSVKSPLLLPMESRRKLGITREESPLEWWEIVLRRIPDNGILLCPQVDGFRGMPAARDSENSSGYGGTASARDSADSCDYGGAADKGMTTVKITNLPEKGTSKHELYELFKTSGHGGVASAWNSADSSGYGGAADKGSAISGYGGAADKGMTTVKITHLPEKGTSKHELYELFKTSGYGGPASAWDSGDSSGYGGAADKGSVALGYGGAAEKGMTTIKSGDAPESRRGWIRDTSRLFWEKPIEDTLVRGGKPIGDHQFQSNRKSNRTGADRNRSQFGCGRPYWKP